MILFRRPLSFRYNLPLPSVRAVCVASREDLSASKCCERLCVMVFFPSASFSSCSASSFCCTPHFSFTLPGSGWGGGGFALSSPVGSLHYYSLRFEPFNKKSLGTVTATASLRIAAGRTHACVCVLKRTGLASFSSFLAEDTSTVVVAHRGPLVHA